MKRQLILTFILVAIIPITLFGILSIIHARSQMNQQYIDQVNAETTRINSTLFDITTSMYTSCEPLINMGTYKTLFASSSVNDANLSDLSSLNSSIKTMHDTTASISSIHIYTNNPNIPSGNYVTSVTDNYLSQAWYEGVSSGLWDNWCCTSSYDSRNHELYELTLTRRIPVASDTYSAYLVITISANYLKNRLVYTDSFLLASIDAAPTFFSSETTWLKQPFPFLENFTGNYYKYTGPLIINNKKVLSNISTFVPYQTQNNFYILVSNFDAYREVNTITLIYSVILLFAIIFPTILILLFSSYFSARVITLRKAMHQASLGDYNIINSFKGDDELSETFTDLKSTVNLIHQKEARFYQTKISEQQIINKQQQMEFKMLASQINPHFLYNTLETIRMQALASGSQTVASSIKLLGKSMHYVLENTGTDYTTLAEELSHVEVYLAIQQLRFGDRVNYEIQIDNNLNLKEYRILPLLLQPVVENAVVHGLEGVDEKGIIEITIKLIESNQIMIKIKDNGDGMDELTLTQLNEKINSKTIDNSSSIGLYNINQRIKLLYGKSYGLYINSVLHHGTTVTLTIPCQLLNN